MFFLFWYHFHKIYSQKNNRFPIENHIPNVKTIPFISFDGNSVILLAEYTLNLMEFTPKKKTVLTFCVGGFCSNCNKKKILSELPNTRKKKQIFLQHKHTHSHNNRNILKITKKKWNTNIKKSYQKLKQKKILYLFFSNNLKMKCLLFKILNLNVNSRMKFIE